MMNRFSRTIALWLPVLLAAVITASPAHSQDKLRWKFRKGETLKYEMKATSDATSPVGAVKSTMTQDMTWTVKSVASDGTAEITQKVTRLRMKVTSPFANQEFDSDKKDGPANPLGALVGQEMTLKLSARGEVKSVTLPEGLKKGLKGLPGGLGGLGGGVGTAESIKQMLGQMGSSFPEKAVKKGDSWTQKAELKAVPMVEVTMEMKYTYQGLESVSGKKLARIDVIPKMTIKTKDGAPFTIAVKDNGSAGKSYFDVETGKLIKSTLTQKLTMEFSAAGQKQSTSMTSVVQMNLK